MNPTTGVVTPIGSGFTTTAFTFPVAGAFNSDTGEFIFMATDPNNGNALSYYRAST